MIRIGLLHFTLLLAYCVLRPSAGSSDHMVGLFSSTRITSAFFFANAVVDHREGIVVWEQLMGAALCHRQMMNTISIWPKDRHVLNMYFMAALEATYSYFKTWSIIVNEHPPQIVDLHVE
uniref:Secreted protein n=1 Tax=Steinernema glaseri TaxID=37863 RepID=A0A1I7Y908_9BILA